MAYGRFSHRPTQSREKNKCENLSLKRGKNPLYILGFLPFYGIIKT